MEFPAARILVFAKAPIPGQAKTRLIPALGAQGAADLHEKMVRHTLDTATQANLCPVELWCANEPDHPFFYDLLQHYPLTLKQQCGNDLGERMNYALCKTLKQSPYALLIGTDSPSLAVNDLRNALEKLKNGDDCVLNPAEDGGYVLIGLSRCDDKIFSDIVWGSSSVLSATRERLQRLDWRWSELETHRDIDRPEDLSACNVFSWTKKGC